MCFDSPHCCLSLPKGLHCELLTWMQLKPHAISLQSMKLFVRLTNHHSGKALTLGLSLMERKGEDTCQCRDYNPMQSSSHRQGLGTGAPGWRKPSRGYRGPDPRVDLWVAHSPCGPSAGVLGMGFLLSFRCLLRSFLF